MLYLNRKSTTLQWNRLWYKYWSFDCPHPQRDEVLRWSSTDMGDQVWNICGLRTSRGRRCRRAAINFHYRTGKRSLSAGRLTRYTADWIMEKVVGGCESIWSWCTEMMGWGCCHGDRIICSLLTVRVSWTINPHSKIVTNTISLRDKGWIQLPWNDSELTTFFPILVYYLLVRLK